MTNHNHGRRRPGAGRPKGRLNDRTIASNEAARALPHYDDPLAWLLALMTDTRQDLRLRIDAARALMPYCHTKP